MIAIQLKLISESQAEYLKYQHFMRRVPFGSLDIYHSHEKPHHAHMAESRESN
jgi:hypothetical protein